MRIRHTIVVGAIHLDEPSLIEGSSEVLNFIFELGYGLLSDNYRHPFASSVFKI